MCWKFGVVMIQDVGQKDVAVDEMVAAYRTEDNLPTEAGPAK